MFVDTAYVDVGLPLRIFPLTAAPTALVVRLVGLRAAPAELHIVALVVLIGALAS